MATQTLAPNDIQARTERLKRRALFNTPKQVTDSRIKVHRCFNQTAGQEKPNSCSCKDRITFSEASTLIARGEAEWLLIRNPKTDIRVEFQRAVVACVSKADTKAQSKQLQKYRKNETEIIERFRKLVENEVSKGDLPPAVLKIGEMELRAYLGSPEKLRDTFPEFGIDPLWRKVVKLSSDFWVNHTDAKPTGAYLGDNLSKELGFPERGNKHGIISTGYDLAKLAQIDSFSQEVAGETENLNVLGSLFRVRPEGYGPDQYESNSDDAD